MSASNRFGSWRRSGFTRVELLVVIAIITILISPLLPALNKVRAQSQTTVCLSNLRQLGEAVFTYVAENKQRLPYNALYMPTAHPTLPNQISNNPLPGLMAEDRLPRGSFLPVVRGFGTSSNLSINTPGFLICPTEAVNGLHTSGIYGNAAGYYEAFSSGRFRNQKTNVQIKTVAGADEGAAIYSDVGYIAATGPNNLVFSHYAFNNIELRTEQVNYEKTNSPSSGLLLFPNGGQSGTSGSGGPTTRLCLKTVF